MEKFGYRFSFGPWNIHEGADPFGPATRPTVAWAQKSQTYRELGFDAVQFHDDDVAPDIDMWLPAQLRARARGKTTTRGRGFGRRICRAAFMGTSADD